MTDRRKDREERKRWALGDALKKAIEDGTADEDLERLTGAALGDEQAVEPPPAPSEGDDARR